MTNYNRELSQFARYVTVDDSTGNVSFGTTFTSNRIGIGTNKPSTALEIVAQADQGALFNSGQVLVKQYNSDPNPFDGPDLRFYTAAGTINSPLAVNPGLFNGRINSYSYNGSAFVESGTFGFRSRGTDGRSAFEVEIFDGTRYNADRPAFVINQNRSVGIGTTNPTSFVHIDPRGSIGAGNTFGFGGGEGTLGALQVDGNLLLGISTQSNYIAFRGTFGEGVQFDGRDEVSSGTDKYGQPLKRWTHCFIGERNYDPRFIGFPARQMSELLLFKGNDAGLTTSIGNQPYLVGPDRIRLLSAEIRIDTFEDLLSGTFEEVGLSTFAKNRVTITEKGAIGIGTTNPTSFVHIDPRGSIGAGNTFGFGGGEGTLGALQVDGNLLLGISTQSNYIAFRGTFGDGVNFDGRDEGLFDAFGQPLKRWSTTFIGERVYDSRFLTGLPNQMSELLIFKGNDAGLAKTSVGGDPYTIGPDRIRLLSPEVRIDTFENLLSGTFEQVGLSTFAKNRVTITEKGSIGVGTTAPTNLVDINSNSFRLRTSRTPSSAGAAGTTGEISWDANYIYVCTASNTWKRASLSSW